MSESVSLEARTVLIIYKKIVILPLSLLTYAFQALGEPAPTLVCTLC
jgi:hypothetical protein